MRNKQLLLLIFILFGFNSLFAQTKGFKRIQELGGIEEYLYEPNGLQVLLMQDQSTPVVTVQIVYRVGSKHEVTGNTGSTHLLEHLMFKGTEKFNKKNGNSIDTNLRRVGAKMNATTWNDRTNYFETIPSDHIEIALEIEADRMRNSLLLKEDKDAEMTVVRNEFERGENSPTKILSKRIWATAYLAHPYHHSTIGWRSDIENIPIEVLRDFYNTYYWPDNATLTVIGDFNKEEIFPLIDKYFGKIPKSPHTIPQPYTSEPEQLGPRRVVVKRPGGNDVVYKAYKIPGRMHPDLPALTVLGQLMGVGPASILSREFVDTKNAIYSYSGPSNFQDVGLYSIILGLSSERNHDEIDDQLNQTIEKLKNSTILQEDVDRVISKLNAQSVLSRDGSGAISSQLNEAIAGGDWKDFVLKKERLQAVNAQDVIRVAKKYLNEDQSTTGYYMAIQPQGSTVHSNSSNNRESEAPDDKYYFRDPSSGSVNQIDAINEREQFQNEDYQNINSNDYTRKKVSGIDVISIKTGAKGFVSISASISIKDFPVNSSNVLVPTMTAKILSQGTEKYDKISLAKELESLGVNIKVSASKGKINIKSKCLKKDIGAVMDLLAEELRNPLFDKDEFQILKGQIRGNLKQEQDDPNTQGSIALEQILFSDGHPNYSYSTEEISNSIDQITVDALKAFHEKYFGPESMIMVVVGDVSDKELHASLKKSFSGWKGGSSGDLDYVIAKKVDPKIEVVSIPQKPSAELFIGQYTGLKKSDDDYIPFRIANAILGRGFSGRLMKTVRDQEGLTYGIRSSHRGDINNEGYWMVNASFNPELFQKGQESTMKQVEKWINEGVTQSEVDQTKTDLIGSFKVGLSTTEGMAATVLSFVERGLSPDYIDEYPVLISKTNIDQVNRAIEKYIDLEKMVIIKCGSLNQDGSPMK